MDDFRDEDELEPKEEELAGSLDDEDEPFDDEDEEEKLLEDGFQVEEEEV